MRRLILALLGIRRRTSEQHIADLEKMLSDLVSARDVLENEITAATRKLLAAQETRDEYNRRLASWIREQSGAKTLPARMPPPAHP